MKSKKSMIEDLHNKAKKQLKKSKQPNDNGTDKTLRNMVLRGTYKKKEINQNDDAYVLENGLIIEDSKEHRNKNMNFLEQEWNDWLCGLELGDSKSQDEYPELWKGKFDNYCYSDRLGPYMENALQKIKETPDSRQNFLSIWTKADELNGSLVPCTIGVNGQIIDNTLYVTFIYRSMEISRNSVNDFFLNKKYIQEILKMNKKVKNIDVTYFINNAHNYIKEFDKEPT